MRPLVIAAVVVVLRITIAGAANLANYVNHTPEPKPTAEVLAIMKHAEEIANNTKK